jgi:hypothetical protein
MKNGAKALEKGIFGLKTCHRYLFDTTSSNPSMLYQNKKTTLACEFSVL